MKTNDLEFKKLFKARRKDQRVEQVPDHVVTFALGNPRNAGAKVAILGMFVDSDGFGGTCPFEYIAIKHPDGRTYPAYRRHKRGASKHVICQHRGYFSFDHRV